MLREICVFSLSSSLCVYVCVCEHERARGRLREYPEIGGARKRKRRFFGAGGRREGWGKCPRAVHKGRAGSRAAKAPEVGPASARDSSSPPACLPRGGWAGGWGGERMIDSRPSGRRALPGGTARERRGDGVVLGKRPRCRLQLPSEAPPLPALLF